MDKSLNYLIDCQFFETTDSIRSQIFQLNATKDQLTSQKEFDHKRHELLVRLSQVLDQESAKNTYLTPELIECLSNVDADRSMTHCQSNLYSLTCDQLLAALDITPKMEDNDDIEVLDVVIKKEDDINRKRKTSSIKAMNGKKSSQANNQNNCPKQPKNVFATMGSFSNGFPKRPVSEPPKASSSSSTNGESSKSLMSPTRVSGIFRSNPSQRSVDIKEDDVEVQEIPAKRSFMSGYEKKIVNDVKNGTVSMSRARKELNTFRQPLKQKSNEESNRSTNEELIDPHYKNIDKHLIETIENEIITHLQPIKSQDVAGLEFAKKKIHEIAILPLKKPHLFTGLRKPPKGILLFGPPGTGKTFLGRWIASETKSTFFEITVSTLNSKWIGEGEKTIRAMFAVARARQPSVIFIDEIDSLLKSRCDSEHESSRRMKTEFFTQFEGVSTATDEKLLIIGATNRPQDLDDAARRRLTARLYIGLPEENARSQLIQNCLRTENHDLTEEQILTLAQKTKGYSGSDIKSLCQEAAMEGVREMEFNEDNEDNPDQIRNITYDDFEKQLEFQKPTVCADDLLPLEDWDRQYGTNRR